MEAERRKKEDAVLRECALLLRLKLFVMFDTYISFNNNDGSLQLDHGSETRSPGWPLRETFKSRSTASSRATDLDFTLLGGAALRPPHSCLLITGTTRRRDN